MPVTFILKGNLPYMPARLYRGKAGSLIWAGMCISVENILQGVLLFTFQRDPLNQGPFENLSVKELLCLVLVDCLLFKSQSRVYNEKTAHCLVIIGSSDF